MAVESLLLLITLAKVRYDKVKDGKFHEFPTDLGPLVVLAYSWRSTQWLLTRVTQIIDHLFLKYIYRDNQWHALSV